MTLATIYGDAKRTHFEVRASGTERSFEANSDFAKGATVGKLAGCMKMTH